MRTICLFAVIAFGLAAPASAEDAAKADKPAKEKRVCRRQVGTGTIMPKSICRSAKDWAAIDEAQAKATDHLLDDTRRPGGPGVGRD